MKNTNTNVRSGTTLNLPQQTNTTREGFTTFAKTDCEKTNVVLAFLEDGVSGLYYNALGRDNVGEDPLGFAKAYLSEAVAALEEL